MSNNRVNVKVIEMEDELALVPKRSFITNRKTQLVLNVILIIIIVILVGLLFRKKNYNGHNGEPISTLTPVSEIESTTHYSMDTPTPQYYTLNNLSFNIISRDDWLASELPDNKSLIDLAHPIELVIIAHTATSDCQTEAACIRRVRNIQKMHQDEHFVDIKYNFLIGGDGLVYEGRGWDKQGDHTKHKTAISISIAFIGNFEFQLPNKFQIDKAQDLIKFGVRTKKVDANYFVCPEKYFSNTGTQSPGKELINIIKKWPHYCNP